MREISLLGGLPVAPIALRDATDAIAARDPAAPFAYVVTTNAQVLILAENLSNGLRAAHERAWMRLNDSRILARLHRWAMGETVPLAAGSDMAVVLFNEVIQPEDAITIIGGGPLLADALRERFGLRHLAQHEPPMGYASKPEAWQAAIDFIEAHPARFVFVVTGAPRSERLMQAVAERGRATGTGMGFGSGLLFVVGLTQRAPAWMQRSGLEWLHRALTEPRRLGQRYVLDFLPLLRLALRARRQRRVVGQGVVTP